MSFVHSSLVYVFLVYIFLGQVPLVQVSGVRYSFVYIPHAPRQPVAMQNLAMPDLVFEPS